MRHLWGVRGVHGQPVRFDISETENSVTHFDILHVKLLQQSHVLTKSRIENNLDTPRI